MEKEKVRLTTVQIEFRHAKVVERRLIKNRLSLCPMQWDIRIFRYGLFRFEHKPQLLTFNRGGSQ